MNGPSEIVLPGETDQQKAKAAERHRVNFIQPIVRYTEQLPEQFIPSRLPSEVFHNGASVEFHILRHHDYLHGDANGRVAKLLHADLARVFFAGWNLSGIDFAYSDFALADLTGACLEGANLDGVRGNGKEIKSAVFGRWPVVWTCCPDYGHRIQIGCQAHNIRKWVKADPRWIRALTPDGDDAEKFWDAHGRTILEIVQNSPAEPWSHASKAGRNAPDGSGVQP